MVPPRPRWLYSVGKQDQARRILANLHSRTQDINSPLINLEMEEIKEKIQIDGVDSMCCVLGPYIDEEKLTSFVRTLVGLQAPVPEPGRPLPGIHGYYDW